MPNRILKESVCRSEEIDALSWFEEVLFYRLIVNCDDYGRFDGRLKIIKNVCFPLKDIRESDVEKALKRLSALGLIRVYSTQGRSVLELITWENHQSIRAKKSKYPAFDSTCMQMNADESKCSRNPIQSESNPNPKNNMCKAEALALFERLWKLYPEKKGKGQVSETKKLAIAEVGEEEMLRALERYQKELKKDSWRKIQNGSTFFNSGYIDYLDNNYVPGSNSQKSGNSFHNFNQRDTNYDSLVMADVKNWITQDDGKPV
ncbi:MAG: transcriptional regulator [Lachnospiraceae bacterium]